MKPFDINTCEIDGKSHNWKQLNNYKKCTKCKRLLRPSGVNQGSLSITMKYPMPQILNKESIRQLITGAVDETLKVEKNLSSNRLASKDLNEIRVKLIEIKEKPDSLIRTINSKNLFNPTDLSSLLKSSLRTGNVDFNIDLSE